MKLLHRADCSISDSIYPPTWIYCSDELTKVEIDNIFRKSWQLVGHVSQFRHPGDFLTLDVPRIKLFAVLGQDGVIRAFHNVCPHRASVLLLPAAGNCGQAVRCPYHGWSFHLDGRLRSVAEKDNYPHVCAERQSLQQLAVDVFVGLVFVRLGGDAPAPSDLLAEYVDDLKPYLTDAVPESDTFHRSIVPFNWKLQAENDLDAEHFATVHPEAASIYGSGNLPEEISPSGAWRSVHRLRMSGAKHWTPRLYQKLLPRVGWLPDHLQHAASTYAIFPSTLLIAFPDRIDVVQTFPDTANRSVILTRSYVHKTFPRTRPQRSDRQARLLRASHYLSDRIGVKLFRQDLRLMELNQRGLEAGCYARGPMSKGNRGQPHFYRRLYEIVPVMTMLDEPEPGRVEEENGWLLSQRKASFRARVLHRMLR